ncbi:hybrid sensor histidine kinase/response regulator [Chengkuizengella axinellae]|uniref:histidine kinase n=1 Tax=Chengkuizengella axinellae TaxID=3064388 RepID=A0ABT9J0Y4_9BACL|nr:ATP-binding protein [Chengkuizengella sp. 2205SS18-9]MDP5275271.1 ATP-binding protein [Chengkuizengella sp. 2205SS18-9]
MKSNLYKKYLKIIGLLIITISCVFFSIYVYVLTQPSSSDPIAHKGVLDLSEWDFQKEGIVSLNGEWEFYDGYLLEPKDFIHSSLFLTNYLMVPNRNNEKQFSGINQNGASTYKLTIKVSGELKDEILGLKITSIRMAHKLFINGQIKGQGGTPAMVREDHVSGSTPYVTYFYSDHNEIILLVQTSKYDRNEGGMIGDIKFGLQQDIHKLDLFLFSTDLSLIVSVLFFGFYHISIYRKRTKEQTYLFSSLFYFSLLLRLSADSEQILVMLIPTISSDVIYKVQDISSFASIVFLLLFVYSLESTLFTNRVFRVILLPIVIYLFVTIFTSFSVYTNIEYFLWLYICLITLFIFIKLIWLYINKQYVHLEKKELLLLIAMLFGTNGSLIILICESVMYSISVNSAANINKTIWIVKAGIAYYIIVMNMLLALRYTNAYNNLEDLSERLFNINEMKDEFLAKTSHELKTPLHGILNISAFLLEEADSRISAKQRENLSLIHDTSMRLSNLVNDLIDVARLKNGEFKLYITNVDLKVSTQMVFDVLAFEIQGKQVQFINEIDKSTLVAGDENRIRQVLYNLIHNAIKHTQIGEITVSSRLVNEMVYFYVEDTGVGIPEEKQEEIFGYFEQLDPLSNQNEYQSMGLGLYISRQLIEKMKGEIRVDWSEVGRGTRLCFSLPRAELSDQKVTNQHRLQSKIQFEKGTSSYHDFDVVNGHKHTILIVDDEPSNIQILMNLLSNREYNVITALSAKEALKKLEKFKQVDLVILDVMMPEMTGIELCQQIRKNYSLIELPVLFATAIDLPEDIELGFKAGANDYITKPFDAKTILARIQTLISMKTSMIESFQNEMAFLQAQIKPHFLYNAISNIIAFCYTDGKKAANLLSMLSQYLRIVFTTDHSTMLVPLEREIKLIKAYVEIQKSRFNQLDFHIDVDKGLEKLFVPSLCIQPFVENAIRHGLFEKDGIGLVTLTIHDHQEYISICIEDNGVGIADHVLKQFKNGDIKNAGVGMSNIKKRLLWIKGSNLKVESILGKGTIITIDLPKQTMEIEELA